VVFRLGVANISAVGGGSGTSLTALRGIEKATRETATFWMALACVVAAIAQHPKWSCQYNVRIALVRNTHTPAASVLAFLPQLTLGDLKQISKLEGLAPHLKKHMREELVRRASERDTPARERPVREIG